jgi:hypothetical protein
MRKKIEKYLQNKRANKNTPIQDGTGRYLIAGDIEGCLRATQSSAFVSRKKPPAMDPKTGKSRSLPAVPMASFDTPSMPPYSVKRPFDMIGDTMYSNLKMTPAVKRACLSESPPASRADMDALSDFLTNLKGGYINGIYLSAVERRRLAEKVAKSGSTAALNNLNLTQEERYTIPGAFRQKTSMLDPYQGRSPISSLAMHVQSTPSFGALNQGFQMKWAMPSPLCPAGIAPNPFVAKFSQPIMHHPHLRPSPLASRYKENRNRTLLFPICSHLLFQFH